MAIRITSERKQIKLPKGLDMFFQISIALFVVVGFMYLFIGYLENRALFAIKEVEETTEQKLAEIPNLSTLERKAHNYRRLLEDFKHVLGGHHIISPVFYFIQEIIHPRAQISTLNINLEEERMDFSGRGESLVIVGQQFYFLKSVDRIRSVELSSLSAIEERTEEGESIRTGVNFSFNLGLVPGIFAFDGAVLGKTSIKTQEEPIEEPIEEPVEEPIEEPVEESVDDE